MHAFLDPQVISAYLEVIMINVILSGDNVIVIGMAAAGLSIELRGRSARSSSPIFPCRLTMYWPLPVPQSRT